MNAAQTLPAVEGLTPAIIWYTLVGLVGIGALIILWDKVSEVFRKRKQRQDDREQLAGQDITDRIADKVAESLVPQIDEKFDSFEKKFDKKFAEIDRKLATDKEMLDLHTTQLNAEKSRVDRLDNDNKALLHGMSALLSHEVNGNNIDKLVKAQSAMSNYLIDRVYKEENWQ